MWTGLRLELSAHSPSLNPKCREAVVRQLLETWAIVLAGGEGTRLGKLTTNSQGIVIPKQYCSIERTTCLLQDALARAGSIAMQSHVCTVVAAQHRQWWTSAVTGLSESNVFVQPQNRGTGYGVLLALLTLEMRNPEATLILLPADHYFREEKSITRALRVAGNLAGANTSTTYLLGADPESPDPELGYILPAGKITDKPAPIAGFREKPNMHFARELIWRGALWNLLIPVGSVSALLKLYAERHADAVRAMREALRGNAAGDPQSLENLYERIEPIDFSQDILEDQAHRLQVIRVKNCGWTDLGTPKRVEATVRSLASRAGCSREQTAHSVPLFFDLGSQYS